MKAGASVATKTQEEERDWKTPGVVTTFSDEQCKIVGEKIVSTRRSCILNLIHLSLEPTQYKAACISLPLIYSL